MSGGRLHMKFGTSLPVLALGLLSACGIASPEHDELQQSTDTAAAAEHAGATEHEAHGPPPDPG